MWRAGATSCRLVLLSRPLSRPLSGPYLGPYLGPFLGPYLGPHLGPYLVPYLGPYMTLARHLLQVSARALTLPDAALSLPARLTLVRLTPSPAALSLSQELTVEGAFVPNDTYCTPEKNVALITGPNSSGKSVYLKQVLHRLSVSYWAYVTHI